MLIARACFKNTWEIGFVSGHDFSRAVTAIPDNGFSRCGTGAKAHDLSKLCGTAKAMP
jgi:hypothetical protein